MVIKSSSFQYDLFGKSFEDVAISIIQQYEPPGGYYLAFSGGKDSVVIYDLAQRAGVKFTSYFSMTTVGSKVGETCSCRWRWKRMW